MRLEVIDSFYNEGYFWNINELLQLKVLKYFYST